MYQRELDLRPTPVGEAREELKQRLRTVLPRDHASVSIVAAAIERLIDAKIDEALGRRLTRLLADHKLLVLKE
jgi:hypothetical protein